MKNKKNKIDTIFKNNNFSSTKHTNPPYNEHYRATVCWRARCGNVIMYLQHRNTKTQLCKMVQER
jgi:hypothetical protein